MNNKIIAEIERLILRRYNYDDIQDLYEYLSNRKVIEYEPNNENSWKLLEKMSFEREGRLKHNVYFWRHIDNRPIWKDTFIYGRLNNINS